MKQFSLEEYLKNPNREVVTRDGRNVRIICTDRKNHDSCPIIALVETDEDDERVRSFKIDGKWSVDGLGSNFDLFFAPEKHEAWINLFRDCCTGVNYPSSRLFNTKKEAKQNVTIEDDRYIASIKIEWEE